MPTMLNEKRERYTRNVPAPINLYYYADQLALAL